MIEIWDKLPLDDRIRITEVSRRFRNVALASSKLWRYIKFERMTPNVKLRTLLSRAGAASLHLSGRFDRSRLTIPPPSFVEFGADQPGPEMNNRAYTFTRRSLIEDKLSQCAVLDANVVQPATHHSNHAQDSLSFTSLQKQMPILRSLSLMLLVGSEYSNHIEALPEPEVPFPLFSAHTPNLRHIDFMFFSPRWDDPLFQNLTYLRLERSNTAATVPQLLTIMKACPNLEYLILNHAIHIHSTALETSPIIRLPHLRHLAVLARESQSLISLFNKLEVPAGPYLSIRTSDYSPLLQHDLHMSSPWAHFSQADGLVISGQGRHRSHISVFCKRSGTTVVAFHLTLEASRHTVQNDNYLSQFVTSLSQSSIARDRIKVLSLKDSLRGIFVQQLLRLFSSTEILMTTNLTVYTPVAATIPANNTTPSTMPSILEFLGENNCPNLRELDIGAKPELPPTELLKWLTLRAQAGSPTRPLKRVTVLANQPLTRDMRQKISNVLETIVWKKAWGFATLARIHPPFQVPFLQWSAGHTPQTAMPSNVEDSSSTSEGDASWDEMDTTIQENDRKRLAFEPEEGTPDYFSVV